MQTKQPPPPKKQNFLYALPTSYMFNLCKKIVWVINLKMSKIVGFLGFYNINVLQQTACLVVNPITVGNFAFLFNCTPVSRTSDSMMVPT